MNNEEYKLTLEDAIKKYKTGHITAKGLLHFYIHIKGGNINESQKEICKKLGISKSVFYKSLNQLEQQKLIIWDAQKIAVMLK